MTSILAVLTHGASPDRGVVAGRANTLRAGVLGANDGIVSVAAIVVGVAGASSAHGAVLLAGLAALIGGAVSMALGEYVSVSSQRDGERAASMESGANPWAAALASAGSFLTGGVLPLIAVVLAQGAARVPVTVLVVLLALALTGAAGARLGGAPALRPTIRTLVGGGLALAATWSIGLLVGTTGLA
ncbi:VIT1/CCC1 transporter family protein [Amnibacterium kyonggiense]|uniref:VIT family protein n=1 Tax=Amnibacterium kyonggiense TaxID=595671 RepID=A0A4R7FKT1_9MICO|nr:VIT1/CCC1 transporter family protein [Amnibacterium kyonggiense]TDS76980.1 VIT family protein [Amnibacterium kyonggiense]